MSETIIKQNYKQTEVGLIPEDWEVKKMSEISSLKGRIGWQGLKQDEFTMNSSQPFLITGMNFKHGEIKWDEVYHVPYERYEIAKEIQLREDDVLMTKDGTIGKILYVGEIPNPGLATLNSHLLLFRPINNSYIPKYLYYHLHTPFFKKHIENTKSGTTFFGISQESVSKHQVLLPPTLNEQRTIATALSDIDELLTSLEQLISKKQAIKQGAMQELLTPPNQGGKRLPGFSGEWEEKKLGELIYSFQNGYGFSASGYKKEGVPIVTMAQIGLKGEFQFNKNKVNYWSSEDAYKLKSFTLYKGDLIISMTDVTPEKNLIGRMAIVDVNGPLFLNQRVGLLRVNKELVDPEILKHLSGMREWRSYSKAIASLGVQANIGTYDIINGTFFLSSIKEQKAIAQVLSDMDEEIKALEEKKVKYQKIKEGMMQELLTGKIRLV